MSQDLHQNVLSRRGWAFTLVELLVVAIIAVVISILLPSPHGERSLLGWMGGLSCMSGGNSEGLSTSKSRSAR